MLTSALHDQKLAGKIFNPSSGCPETNDTLRAGANKHIWLKLLANEIGHCFTGLSKLRKPCDVIKGNNLVFFLEPRHVTANRKVIYCNFVCTMCPNKSKVYRVIMTVGGDCLDTYQDVHSPAVSILDVKLRINSTISDAHKGSRYCTADIKDFFLHNASISVHENLLILYTT